MKYQIKIQIFVSIRNFSLNLLRNRHIFADVFNHRIHFNSFHQNRNQKRERERESLSCGSINTSLNQSIADILMIRYSSAFDRNKEEKKSSISPLSPSLPLSFSLSFPLFASLLNQIFPPRYHFCW